MKQVTILTLLLCCVGCSTRNPYPMFFQSTSDGLKPIQPAQRYVVQRCTPEALEARSRELLADGYVIIGRAEFTTEYPYHKEVMRQEDSQGAEIILCCDTPESAYMELRIRPNGTRYGRTAVYPHVAVYFARPAG